MSRLAAASLAVLLAASLAGCGELGTLDRPAPLFGAQAKADYLAKKKAEEVARARARVDSNQTNSSDDPNIQPLNQAPYSNPIPGGPSGDAPPEGALPNVGSTPNS
jgi:hypothetical protein